MDRTKEELKQSEEESVSSVLPDTFWEILQESALDVNEVEEFRQENEIS